MKKTLALLLCVLLILSLCACAKPAEANPAADYRTLGDVYADQSAEELQVAYTDWYYVYAFDLGDVPWRAIVSMDEETSDRVWAVEWDDPDRDAKLRELTAPLTIERLENLNEMILPQEELDKLVGKTGKDLFDDGWISVGWDLNNMEFWMEKGPFDYAVICEGKVEDYEDFEDEMMYDFVIKSIRLNGLGDAANLALDENGKLID